MPDTVAFDACAVVGWLVQLATRGIRRRDRRDLGETYGMPEDRTSLQEVQRALTVLARRENRPEMYRRLAERSGLNLQPAEVWLLLRVDALGPANLDELIPRFDVSPDRLTEAAQALHERTLLTDGLTPTPTGEQTMVRLREARRDGLANLLNGWSPAEHPELAELITRLSGALTDSEPRPDRADHRQPLTSPLASEKQ